ncbi:FAD-dependent oxidoreductase [Candidatus Dependentiae bacterium]|nr:FAD-dependent oxidoreductase [Candidatus Dependentiae bacterium]MBU4386873.1 FAD-dependent oxidoreductase [Candidatus Dependentiae bacterium]MCG2756482.1 FAD-dependent oxidoreductase [Candidatus Dependentiae bacterium]
MKKLIFNKIHIILWLITVFFSSCDWTQKKVDTTAKYNWVASSEISKIKQFNEYDAIVVGSGVGGLSCASILAKNGYKVLVLEQHEQVGGFCSSYMRNGFYCTVGVEDISGLWKFGATQRLLDILELKKEDLFVLHKRTYFIGDQKIIFDGTKQDFIKQLSKYFPEEKENLEKFLNQAEQAILERSNQAEKYWDIYKKWSTVTYEQILNEFFKNEELKNILCSLLGYIGAHADQIPASGSLFVSLQYFIYGGCHPQGGVQSFVNTLKDFIEKNNGTVLTSRKVDKILVKDNKVYGINVGEQIFLSPIIIANVNAKTTFSKLLDQDNIDQNFVKAVNKLKMSTSAFVVNLGVDMDLSQHTSFISIPNSCHVLIGSNINSNLAPKGKASVTLITLAKYKDFSELNSLEYAKYKEKMAQKIIDKVEMFIPGFSKKIIFKDILTPKSYEKFTSMPEGAIYSFDFSENKNRPYFKTSVKGLYLASASVSGGGVEAVIGSGMKCANDILDKKI